MCVCVFVLCELFLLQLDLVSINTYNIKQVPHLLFVLNMVGKCMCIHMCVATCIEAAALTQKYILVAPVFFSSAFLSGLQCII